MFSPEMRSRGEKRHGTASNERIDSVLKRQVIVLWAICMTFGLAACESDGKTVYPEDDNRKSTGSMYEERSSIFGPSGFNIGGDDEVAPGTGGGGIGVNSYLWRASLDTISFMPLASADPFGGVIITDWYSPPQSQNERFKINLFILGRDLRADGLRASVFRQERINEGEWVDATVGNQTPIDLENAILTRARQLRIASLQ
jgi:hypothetical protein